MPNAKDVTIEDLGAPKFLLMGDAGSGKTTQFLTLPGKKFAYLFDPSALTSLRGHDIDFEMFVPKVVSLAAQSLTKGKGDPKHLKIVDADQMYVKWEADIEEKIEKGFFAPYSCILFDSFTTFSEIVMDRILVINGRAGQWPQQDDWTAQMGTISRVIRTLTGQMGLTLVCTAHTEVIKDELTHRVINEIILTGKLKARLPLLFSDIWHLEVQQDAQGKPRWKAQTIPDRTNPKCRSSFAVNQFEDITIEDFSKPGEYGLGKLIRERARLEGVQK